MTIYCSWDVGLKNIYLSQTNDVDAVAMWYHCYAGIPNDCRSTGVNEKGLNAIGIELMEILLYAHGGWTLTY